MPHPAATGRMANLRTITVLPTPFLGGRVDIDHLAKAIHRQIAVGMDAVVVCDAIGEGHALLPHEREAVISHSVGCAVGRIAVLVAIASNDTARAVTWVRQAEALGGDGVLVALPPYSKPSAAGVVLHLRMIAAATHLPVIIDDDPQRCVIEGGARLLAALGDVQTIVGMRHGPGRLSAFTQMPADLRRRYHHYCGDDLQLPAFIACGCHGVISAFGTLFPEALAALGRGFPGAAARLANNIGEVLAASAGQWDAAVVKAACHVLECVPGADPDAGPCADPKAGPVRTSTSAAMPGPRASLSLRRSPADTEHGTAAVRLPLVAIDEEIAAALRPVLLRIARGGDPTTEGIRSIRRSR